MADWQPGDLALQIRDLMTLDRRLARRAGGCYVVERVVPGASWLRDGAAFIDDGLVLFGVTHANPEIGSWHGNFRKVTPGADIEGFEERRRLPVEEDA